MTNYKNIILENRTYTTALKVSVFEKDEEFKNWKSDIETLRIKMSAYAVANRTNANDEAIEASKTDVFIAYKKVLGYFTNKTLGEKLKAQATDLNSLLTFIGANRKQKDSEKGKQFLPVGSTTFRKSVEDFIADRLNNAACKTAEEIEEERKARNKAKAEAKKAKSKK